MSNERPKICPILSSGAIVGGKDGQNRAVDCIRERCQHWTSAPERATGGGQDGTGFYHTDGRAVFDCAVVISARKDHNGRIPV